MKQAFPVLLILLFVTWPLTSTYGQSLPLIVIQDITWTPKDPVVGDIMQFTVYFGNQGSAPIPIWFFLCDYVDEILVNRVGVRPLDAGNMGNVNIFTWQVTTTGPHTVKVLADCTNQIAQSSRSSNVMVKFFRTFSAGVSENYLVHIYFNFFLTLDRVSVSLFNQNDRLLAVTTVVNPTADHADIRFSTTVPVTSITARAAGQVKFSFIILPVSGSNTIDTTNVYEDWMEINLF